MTETEYQLFYQVPPDEYLRHVAQDTQKLPARPPPSPSRSYCNPSTANSSTQTEEESNWPVPNFSSSVQTLINRFNEVSSWVTHAITSGTTIEERQAVLSCLLRVAQTCWNTGNFNSAMEIVAGLNLSTQNARTTANHHAEAARMSSPKTCHPRGKPRRSLSTLARNHPRNGTRGTVL